MGEKQKPWWLILLCILIMAASFSDKYWIIPWYWKYVCQITIIGLALIWLLVHADFNRLALIWDYFVIYLLPLLGIVIVSLTIWIWDFQVFTYISRGFSTILYHIITICFVCAVVYLFGGKAIDYTVYSMIIANSLLVCYSVMTYGVQEFVTGLIILIKSAGIETTPAIKTLEVHDLAFALGLYVVYYLIFEKGKRKWCLLLICTLFFFLGYKRIALLAIGGVVFVHLLFRKKTEETQIRLFQVLSWSSIFICFAYVFIIECGLFDMIVDYLKLDTMGRKELYAYFRPFYELNPLYKGYGIGYVGRHLEQGVSLFGDRKVVGLHNDIVVLYIELGFVGFTLWIWYEIRYRILWGIKKFGMKNTILLWYGTIYTFITYTTDNTVFYTYINTIFMLLPLAYTVRAFEAKTERMSGENGK